MLVTAPILAYDKLDFVVLQDKETEEMVRRALLVLVVLAVVLAMPVWVRYHRDIRAARARVASGSKVVSTPCGLVEYADVGTGPAILAIHGAGGGFDQSLDLAKAFLQPGYRVIAPSRFGYLRTPLPADASPMAQADAHACLLDALQVQKVVVLGGSMGAPSAMQFLPATSRSLLSTRSVIPDRLCTAPDQ